MYLPNQRRYKKKNLVYLFNLRLNCNCILQKYIFFVGVLTKIEEKKIVFDLGDKINNRYKLQLCPRFNRFSSITIKS